MHSRALWRLVIHIINSTYWEKAWLLLCIFKLHYLFDILIICLLFYKISFWNLNRYLGGHSCRITSFPLQHSANVLFILCTFVCCMQFRITLMFDLCRSVSVSGYTQCPYMNTCFYKHIYGDHFIFVFLLFLLHTDHGFTSKASSPTPTTSDR